MTSVLSSKPFSSLLAGGRAFMAGGALAISAWAAGGTLSIVAGSAATFFAQERGGCCGSTGQLDQTQAASTP